MVNFFKRRSSFVPGDLCWLVVPKPERYAYLSGRECTVVSNLAQHTFSDGTDWAHEIDIIGEPLQFFATPDVLRKQLPPETRLENWDECVFKPSVAVPQNDKEPARVEATHHG